CNKLRRRPVIRWNCACNPVMTTVARPAQVFVRGQGSWLWDSDDRAYLDFSQGNAANSLGHSTGDPDPEFAGTVLLVHGRGPCA
ncbi:hypothetical protein Q6331_28440, partial [Klebsiella pneumoniae]|nr:hypothetical protein [Klebsiella pneumoniae]